MKARWEAGGFAFLGAFADVMITPEANHHAAEFSRSEMSKHIKKPEIVDMLLPNDHPICVNRLCLDTDYLETVNQPHVDLIDVRKSPVTRISEKGVVCGDTEYEVDAIVFATGFDAMTGAITNVDIRGRKGEK